MSTLVAGSMTVHMFRATRRRAAIEKKDAELLAWKNRSARAEKELAQWWQWWSWWGCAPGPAQEEVVKEEFVQETFEEAPYEDELLVGVANDVADDCSMTEDVDDETKDLHRAADLLIGACSEDEREEVLELVENLRKNAWGDSVAERMGKMVGHALLSALEIHDVYREQWRYVAVAAVLTTEWVYWLRGRVPEDIEAYLIRLAERTEAMLKQAARQDSLEGCSDDLDDSSGDARVY